MTQVQAGWLELIDGGLSAGLDSLVALSAAVAGGGDVELSPYLEDAGAVCPPEAVEEALLQSYLFLGYPAALNALARWREVSGRGGPEAAPLHPEEWLASGEVTCRRVYGSAYPSLRDNIGEISPDMDVWMVAEGYGKVLSRPGLELPVRECCIAAILAVLGTAPQLRSHLRGALLTGTPVQVVSRVLERALEITPEPRRARARKVWDQVRARWEER